jgi:hypothetical protein
LSKNKKRRGNGDKRRIEGVNLLKAYCMHIWKYHNETFFAQLTYSHKKWSTTKRK